MQASVDVAAVKTSVKENYFHARFRESLRYFRGKNKWIFHGVVHDSCSHGAVDRSSVPGSFRRRDESFHLTKCMYLPESSHGGYSHVQVQNVEDTWYYNISLRHSHRGHGSFGSMGTSTIVKLPWNPWNLPRKIACVSTTKMNKQAGGPAKRIPGTYMLLIAVNYVSTGE